MPRKLTLLLLVTIAMALAAGCNPVPIDDVRFTTFMLPSEQHDTASDEAAPADESDRWWENGSFIWFAWDSAVLVEPVVPANIPPHTRISKALLTIPVLAQKGPDPDPPYFGLARGPKLALAAYRVLDPAWAEALPQWLGQSTIPPDAFLQPSTGRPQYVWPDSDNREYVPLQFDITDIVQAWLSGEPNHGLVITALPSSDRVAPGGWHYIPTRPQVFSLSTLQPAYEQLTADIEFRVWP